jgi:hypothetical protein
MCLCMDFLLTHKISLNKKNNKKMKCNNRKKRRKRGPPMLLHRAMALGMGACPGNKHPSPPRAAAYFREPTKYGTKWCKAYAILCPSYFHYRTQLRNKERVRGGGGVGWGGTRGKGRTRLRKLKCDVVTSRRCGTTLVLHHHFYSYVYARCLSHLLLFTLVDLHDDFFLTATSVLHHLLYSWEFNTAFNHIKGKKKKKKHFGLIVHPSDDVLLSKRKFDIYSPSFRPMSKPNFHQRS